MIAKNMVQMTSTLDSRWLNVDVRRAIEVRDAGGVACPADRARPMVEL